MCKYSYSVEYVASRGYEPHLVSGWNSKIIITGQAIHCSTSTNVLIICLKSQTATSGCSSCTICVSVDRGGKVLPRIILEYSVILCRLLRLVVDCHNNTVVNIRYFESEINVLAATDNSVNVETKCTSSHIVQGVHGRFSSYPHSKGETWIVMQKNGQRGLCKHVLLKEITLHRKFKRFIRLRVGGTTSIENISVTTFVINGLFSDISSSFIEIPESDEHLFISLIF